MSKVDMNSPDEQSAVGHFQEDQPPEDQRLEDHRLEDHPPDIHSQEVHSLGEDSSVGRSVDGPPPEPLPPDGLRAVVCLTSGERCGSPERT